MLNALKDKKSDTLRVLSQNLEKDIDRQSQKRSEASK
jgi:hypothetical protein